MISKGLTGLVLLVAERRVSQCGEVGVRGGIDTGGFVTACVTPCLAGSQSTIRDKM